MPDATQRVLGQSHGERRRQEILASAVDLGSAEGLAAVSIARLAQEVGMSKSGLIAHFASKEDLQLATVETAARGYEARVVEACLEDEPGLERLRRMLGEWLSYIEEIDYRGGCFFAAAGHEFDSRPGPVRERVAHHTRRWIEALQREARVAKRQREIHANVDPNQLVFELHAFVQEANLMRRLLDDPRAFSRARKAITRTLDQASAAAELH